MDENQKSELIALAEDAFYKQEKLRNLSMMNTPTDYEDRKQNAIEYAIARAESNEAAKLLNEYIRAFEE